jgi:hypothetical protein
VRVLEHKGAVSSCVFLLPPPAMLEPEAWSPARRLTALQKGADETEPFACRLFSRTDRCEQEASVVSPEHSLEKMGSGQPAEFSQQQSEDNGMGMDELKQINHQLYQFAVKNILNAK